MRQNIRKDDYQSRSSVESHIDQEGVTYRLNYSTHVGICYYQVKCQFQAVTCRGQPEMCRDHVEMCHDFLCHALGQVEACQYQVASCHYHAEILEAHQCHDELCQYHAAACSAHVLEY